MNKQKRYLITTADEKTWKFDRPVIFLGIWCCLYERRNIWQNMDAIIAKPYGLDPSKKKENYFKLKQLEEKLFPQLCYLLNQYHRTHHNERFWWILVGHWFKLFTNLLLNRFNTLEESIKLYEISGSSIFKSDSYSLATENYSSAVLAIDDLHWNNMLNSTIINLIDEVNFPIEFITKKIVFNECQSFKSSTLKKQQSLKKNFLNWSQDIYNIVSRKLVNDEDGFIISSYLPIKEEIKLELALGQFPQLWKKIIPEINKTPSKLLRKNLSKQFSNVSENNLERILRLLLFEMLPVCYLEGFSDLEKIVDSQPWPKLPKFIFTSNNFESDDVFKLWTAKKVEYGTKYYVGQHGNNYWTMKYRFPRVEEKTADKFFTWGWVSSSSQKFIPAFFFKIAKKNKKNYNNKGGLLLVETSLNLKLTTWNVADEFDAYFKDQKEFVKKLDPKPKQNLTIRLGSIYKKKIFSEASRWSDFDPNLKIDHGDVAIKHLIADSRLVVHSYDSTGILETLFQNIPTLIFWQNDFEHLREKVQPYYQMLIDAGILHLTNESVAKKVNEVWDNVDIWWHQSHLQKARKKFCDQFAKECEHPIKKMVSLLSSN